MGDKQAPAKPSPAPKDPYPHPPLGTSESRKGGDIQKKK